VEQAFRPALRKQGDIWALAPGVENNREEAFSAAPVDGFSPEVLSTHAL
jgi:hypothetical protein